MKIKLKDDSTTKIIESDTSLRVTYIGHHRCYIVCNNTICVLERGESLNCSCTCVEMITDDLDNIILYHSDALKVFQDRQKPQPESEPIEPQAGE